MDLSKIGAKLNMVYDLQKASMWKRIAAWMFDGILTATLAVGFGLLLSVLLGYDAHNEKMETSMAAYESQYGVVFDISQEEFLAMTDAQRQNYDDAYATLIADGEFVYAYNMSLNLTMVITTVSILLAMVIWEFAVALYFGNGQTLGKKIFGLGLVRTDGVRVNNLQLFTRVLLGKFTIGTMLPVYLVILLLFGSIGLLGTVLLMGIGLAQLLCVILSRTNAFIHDLMAGTAVVDISSQMIFRTTEDLLAYKKQVAAEQAARQAY